MTKLIDNQANNFLGLSEKGLRIFANTHVSRNFMKDISLQKLKTLNYFKYNSSDDKQKLMDAVNNSANRKGLNKLINKFTFNFDQRSFLIDESIDADFLQIDNKHAWDKWIEFSLAAPGGNLDFIKFLKTLGISISFPNKIILDEENEIAMLNIEINNINHSITYHYLNDEQLIYNFTNIIQNELVKTGSEERCYLIDRFPTILIFITPAIFQLLANLESDNGFELLSPDNWLKKYSEKGH